ncbi:MAG: hypothetical protein LQ340_005711 [Diploschistes diacapsis]|nr:MAG: hypothetical protein LQ340_005711 [Diploschistes diacapsis]
MSFRTLGTSEKKKSAKIPALTPNMPAVSITSLTKKEVSSISPNTGSYSTLACHAPKASETTAYN